MTPIKPTALYVRVAIGQDRLSQLGIDEDHSGEVIRRVKESLWTQYNCTAIVNICTVTPQEPIESNAATEEQVQETIKTALAAITEEQE